MDLVPQATAGNSGESQRRRRQHTRSRGGCRTCKRRHVRCGEQRPICTNCLTRGHPCAYDDPPPPVNAQPSSLPPARAVSAGFLPDPGTVLSDSPADPFGSLGIEMPGRSHELLQHYVVYRDDLRRLVLGSLDQQPSLRSTPDFRAASQEIAAIHSRGRILMAAKHGYGLTGSCFWSTSYTFLYHKAALIRSLNDRLGENMMRPNHLSSSLGGWSMRTVFFLISMESLDRNTDAAETHISGLMSVLSTIRFRDASMYASGLTMLKLCLVFFSMLEGAKKGQEDPRFNPDRWRAASSPFALVRPHEWADVAYVLLLMVDEFLIGPDDHLPASLPTGRGGAAACLAWLGGALRTVHAAGGATRQDGHLHRWALAGVAFALLLASLPDAAEGGTQQQLRDVREWWEGRVAAWLGTRTLPGCGLVGEVLDKIAWLTTADGEGVIEQLRRGVDGAGEVSFGVHASRGNIQY